MFAYDGVTGNASGSYTFNLWEAEENLCHNWELLCESLTEFGYDMSYLENGPEACDVTIRCYLLGQAISEVLDEMETEEAQRYINDNGLGNELHDIVCEWLIDNSRVEPNFVDYSEVELNEYLQK